MPDPLSPPEEDVGGLNQPLTRWHELRNVLQHVTTTSAVIAERQSAATAQGERIEKSITALHGRMDSIGVRTSHLEKEVALVIERMAPMRAIVYGMVAIIVVGVLSALITLVLRK